MASRTKTVSSRVPTKRIGSTTGAPATIKPSSATMIRALAPKPAKGGQYSVTTRIKAAETLADVKAEGLADGGVQLEIDGTTIRLSRREARALADKLALLTR